MIRKSLLFISIFAAVLKCDARTRYGKDDDLNGYLERAYDFFEKIKLVHASGLLSEDAVTKIDQEITEYVRNATNVVSNRCKRQSTLSYKYSNEGINMLEGFEDFLRFDGDGTRDIKLFSVGYESSELNDAIWFAAVLDDRQVSVHRITINDGSLSKDAASYPVTNGTRLIVNSCACGALLIIEHRNGSVLVLSFTKSPNTNDFVLRASDQDLELNSTTDLAIWNGISTNQLYLGVATRGNISVYTWFGKYFDLTQVIDRGAERLVPFKSKGSMHLAVITVDYAATLIFRHFLESKQFLLVQRLPPSRDASFFEFRFDHDRFSDRFFCLSTGSSGVVIYKQTYDRFVPFQRIPLYTRFVLPIVSIPRKAILLLVGTRQAAMIAYQYDGWRFVRPNPSSVNLAVGRFGSLVSFRGDQLPLIESKDDGNWTLKQPVWVRRSSYQTFRDEAKRWIVGARNRARRTIKVANSRQLAVQISKARVDRLRATNMNGNDSQKLANVSREYGKLVSKLEQRSITDNSPKEKITLTIDLVRARSIRAKCKSNCNVNRLYAGNLRRINSIWSKSRMIPKALSSTDHRRLLNVGEVKNWKCPFISISTEGVNVRGSINGVPLNDLRDRAFRVTGNQKISGEHVFAGLNVTDVYAPLNIAMNITSQRLTTKDAQVKRLKLTTAGILLPLNGSSTTITGSIETGDARVKHIRLRGKPIGDGTRRLRPVTFVDEPIFRDDNVTVENVKIENLAVARLIGEKVGSIEVVLDNAISLRDDRVPATISLTFSSENAKWSNVVLHGGPWMTRNLSRNAATGTVSGKKHFPRDVEITEFSRDRCQLPNIHANVCGNYVIAPKIETTGALAIINGTMRNVTATQTFGRLGERRVSDSSFNPVFPNSERYQRRNRVIASNVSAIRIDNGVTEKTAELANIRFDRHSLVVDASSFEAIRLTGNSLLSPVQLDVQLAADTTSARMAISEKNVDSVRIVNDVRLNDFSANAIKIERIISLANVQFRDGFSVGCVHAFRRPSYSNASRITGGNGDARYILGRKNVFGQVETDAINIPSTSYFHITRNESPINGIVRGSARFSSEPRINVANGARIDQQLDGNIWLTTDEAMFRGARLHFRDAVGLGNVTALLSGSSMSTIHPETWKNVSRRVLSKTRSQEVSVDAVLRDVRARIVAAVSNVSTVKCSLTDFSDVFENSLLKNEKREVRARWAFDEVNVTGTLFAGSAINDLDLGHDVARYDSKENVFSGKKTVVTVTAESFDGCNLKEWFARTLNIETNGRTITIMGRKIFEGSAHFDADVTVAASPPGSSMTGITSVGDWLLSKSANQTIHGEKVIRGFLDASELMVHGSVNDLNLTELTNNQLKKRGNDDKDRLRSIKTSIEFRNSLDVVNGSLAINGAYANAEMSNLHASYWNQTSPIVYAIDKFSVTGEAIVAAFIDRATYLNKLEIVKDAASVNISGLNAVERIRCEAANFSPRCTGKPITDFDLGINATGDDFVLLRSVVVDNEELIVLVKRASVAIFPSSDVDTPIHLRAPILHLHISKITDAFLEETRHSLWIVLRSSSHVFILRYQPCWRALENYVLPGSDAFATSRSSSGQLLLISSDGLWNLGGLATPRNIVRIPLEKTTEIRVSNYDFYVKSISPRNRTTVMKARYVTMAN